MASERSTLARYGSHLSFAFRTFILRQQVPYLFILVLNDSCNLDCYYCESKNTGRYDLDWDTAKRLLGEAYARGSRALVITGGEPMMWRDGEAGIADVVEHAVRLGFLQTAVFTNGTFPLTVPGCTYIVTIDGTEPTHNAIRRGSYQQILAHARQTTAKVIASITITRANEKELEAAVGSIAATGAFDGITFNLLTHSPEIVARHGVTGDQRVAVLDRMWNLKLRGFPVLLSRAAYGALRRNDWKRPVRQIQLAAGRELFTCCRDVGRPDVCRDCGYTSCAEIALAVAGSPGAALELLRSS